MKRKLSSYGVWSCLLLLASLVSCSVTSDGPRPATEGGKPQTGQKPEALVLGETQSPILDELSKRMRIVQYDGSQAVSDYENFIFDGDAFTSEEVKEHEVIRDALRSEKWVLALDVNGSHKQDGIGAYLPFASKGDSPGYLVRTTLDGNGRSRARIIEYPLAGETNKEVTSEAAVQGLDDAEGTASERTSLFVAAVVENVTNHSLAARQIADIPQPGGIPDDLIYTAVSYSQPVNWTENYTGRSDGTSQGTQTIAYKMDYDFHIFLNNQSQSAKDDFQYVIADVLATANPTNGANNFLAQNRLEYAWWQDRLKFSMEVTSDDASSFELLTTTPQTPNNTTSVTSGSSFSIGFDGKSATGSYTYDVSQTKDITDWQVTDNSSATGTLAAWDYRSQNPNADKDYGCNGWGLDCNGFHDTTQLPTTPNNLSMTNLQAPAQAVWKTNGVLDGWTTFTLNSEQHVADTYWCGITDGFCEDEGAGLYQRDSKSASHDFAINMAAVIPIDIESVAFNLNPAPAGETVTGTITLKSAAQVDTTVQLSSDSENATVKPTVIIPQGQTSADFQVLTSTNGIAPGSSEDAFITAFYADDYTVKLTVKNGASTDLQRPTTAPGHDDEDWYDNAPQGSRWVVGYKVRYAVTFVDAAGNESERGPWTPWFSGNYTDSNGNPQAYVEPALTGIATDPTSTAAARNVYRQFLVDYDSGDPSAGVTKVITLNDNTTTRAADTNIPQ